jgi:hypothetical protein
MRWMARASAHSRLIAASLQQLDNASPGIFSGGAFSRPDWVAIHLADSRRER